MSISIKQAAAVLPAVLCLGINLPAAAALEEVGNYAQRKLTLAASGPISEKIAFRLSGHINDRDGFLKNSAGEDLNAANDWNAMAQMLCATITDTWLSGAKI